MHRFSRRSFIASAAALTVAPHTARAATWDAVGARAAGLEQCHALMIHQDGQEVFADAFRGPPIGAAVPVKSVSKTIVAALTGAALARGEIPDVAAPLSSLAPRLIPRGADPRVGAITVENLVTMQAGLERTSGANYGSWVSSPDWVADALSRPFVAQPGAQMLYSTGSFHVLGAVLSEVSGQSLLTLARRRLGDPLGIEIPAWTRDPQGRYLGGNEMALSLPAMIRFAEMVRAQGQWNGTEVLPESWIRASMMPRTRSPFSGLRYGYGWFLGRADGHDYALARGFGGQIICVVPTLALSVVITSDPTRPARSGGYFGDLMSLLEGDILRVAAAARG